MKHYSNHVIRTEKLLNELEQNSNNAYINFSKDKFVNPKKAIPILQKNKQKSAKFPSISETQLVRHYYRLAKQNYAWEDGLYPLGSCTMKYNPIINDELASNTIIQNTHPEIPTKYSQGCLKIIFEVQEMLKNMLDIDAVSLLPAAGAHGEFIGVKMADKYFQEKNENRSKILIPDSAHGTNPASAAMGGFYVEKVSSYSNGLINMEELEEKIDENTAMFMITNPNTLGIFEKNILKIQNLLEKKGALLYMDGANMNAIIGKVSLRKNKIDIIQLNLHKTFSTPHGGGGPGQGALGISKKLLPFLPDPIVEKTKENGSNFYKFITPQKTIGKMKGYYGQFGLIVRAWAYLKSYGNTIEKVSERAVLNANYIKVKLKNVLDVSTELNTMHEVVFTDKSLQKIGISTLHFAKALLDRGFYAPTIYFPLNVSGAIMLETTETETKEELDLFVETVREIIQDAQKNPKTIRESTHNTLVRKIDEVQAARNPQITW